MQVQSINTVNSNTAFGAKLVYGSSFRNKARWNNVAKIFEEQTERYPDYTFNIFHYKNDKGAIRFDYTFDSKERFVEDLGYIKPRLAAQLRKLSDSELATKLKKLFIIQKNADKLEEMTSNIADRFNINETMPDEFQYKFWRNFFDTKRNYVKVLLAEDNLLSRPNAIEIP